jgi:hypothetical protein
MRRSFCKQVLEQVHNILPPAEVRTGTSPIPAELSQDAERAWFADPDRNSIIEDAAVLRRAPIKKFPLGTMNFEFKPIILWAV